MKRQMFLQRCYEMLESCDTDPDYILQDNYARLCREDKNNIVEYDNAYDAIIRQRDCLVKPNDVQGEIRCLRNVEYYLKEIQKMTVSGKIIENSEYIRYKNAICIEMIKLKDYYYAIYLRYKKRFAGNYGNKYDSDFDSYYDQWVRIRIFGKKEDGSKGWIANYNAGNGEFINFARSHMSHFKEDFLKQCIENDKPIIVNNKKSQEPIIEIDGEWKLILAYIIKDVNSVHDIYVIGNVMGKKSKKLMFYRIFLSDILSWLVRYCNQMNFEANFEILYEDMDIDFLRYVINGDCSSFSEIAYASMKTYEEIGIDRKGEIQYKKKGIFPKDEILTGYFNHKEKVDTYKVKSVKKVRNEYWRQYKDICSC